MKTPIAHEIERLLEAALAPTLLVVTNDTANHHGHAGDDGSGESHFTVEIESAAFTGRSPNARLTIRWRSSRETPVNTALSISTEKCDSPLPSSPEWPWWRALSLLTINAVGANSASSRRSIS